MKVFKKKKTVLHLVQKKSCSWFLLFPSFQFLFRFSKKSNENWKAFFFCMFKFLLFFCCLAAERGDVCQPCFFFFFFASMNKAKSVFVVSKVVAFWYDVNRQKRQGTFQKLFKLHFKNQSTKNNSPFFVKKMFFACSPGH